jgi:hypothetical protein
MKVIFNIPCLVDPVNYFLLVIDKKGNCSILARDWGLEIMSSLPGEGKEREA